MAGKAANGADAVREAQRLRPDVVLMDVRVPGMDGIEATRRITAAGEGSRVLIVTTFALDEYVYAGLRAGASGFLLKDARREREVLVAIGHGWTNTEIAERLVRTESTVKKHVGRVLAKLGARDRIHAVILAYDAGLVVPKRAG